MDKLPLIWEPSKPHQAYFGWISITLLKLEDLRELVPILQPCYLKQGFIFSFKIVNNCRINLFSKIIFSDMANTSKLRVKKTLISDLSIVVLLWLLNNMQRKNLQVQLVDVHKSFISLENKYDSTL